MRYWLNQFLLKLRAAGLYHGPIHHVMKPETVRLFGAVKAWRV